MVLEYAFKDLGPLLQIARTRLVIKGGTNGIKGGNLAIGGTSMRW
jgi:hypothetical protein